MTMSPSLLLAHADSGEPWPAGDDGFGDVAAAYRAALAVRALRSARGELPRGFKIGFTNRTIWALYGVWAPIWGTVWDTTLVPAPRLSLAGLCQPRIEPEVVFGFKATPRDGDVHAALDWIAPGFEIVQSHRPGWRFDAAQTVADGGLHGRLYIGERVPMADFAVDAEALHRRLAEAEVVLQRNGVAVDRGRGANVLDSPLRALEHFIAELRACPGAPDIAAGDVVTTGTWTDAHAIAAGETWRADFGTLLASPALTFVQA